MATVALIGPDGAGKTTLARMLEASEPGAFRYLYMGVNTSSSNVALPTSRLAEKLKRRPRTGRSSPATSVPDGPPARENGMRRSRFRAGARLANRLAEEWYRQAVAWSYELRGFTVLYDRHFLFDFAESGGREGPDPLDRRVHRWLLRRFYPQPDLVLFLDAPAGVLFARKGESTLPELERRRRSLLRLGAQTPGFVRVDARRPLPDVFDEVSGHVMRVHRRKGG